MRRNRDFRASLGLVVANLQFKAFDAAASYDYNMIEKTRVQAPRTRKSFGCETGFPVDIQTSNSGSSGRLRHGCAQEYTREQHQARGTPQTESPFRNEKLLLQWAPICFPS
jgi:hypothetical protein